MTTADDIMPDLSDIRDYPSTRADQSDPLCSPLWMVLGTLQIHGDRAALFAALARAQAGYQPIPRSRTVKVKSDKGEYTFDYAPLEEVLTATLPSLNANGLALMSVMGDPEGEDTETELHTLLTHESGAFLHTVERLPSVGKAQERGSQVTYRRRYQTGCLTGTSPEFDDDGNQADGNRVQGMTQKRREPPPPARHDNMQKVIEVGAKRAEQAAAKYQEVVEVVTREVKARPEEPHPHAPSDLAAAVTQAALGNMTPAQKATFAGPTVFTERVVVNDEPLSEDTATRIKGELLRSGYGQTAARAKLTEVCGAGKSRENLTEADGLKLLGVLQREASK